MSAVFSRARKRLPVLASIVALVTGSLLVSAPMASADDDIDCAKVKCIALTYDDGPGPFTDRLLQVLKDNNAKATFFEIASKAILNPTQVQRAQAAGMEIGNHTWDHPDMSASPAPWVTFQFAASQAALRNIIGHAPTLYRPAGGLSNDFVRSEAARAGLAEILWDVIPFDWEHDGDPQATINDFKRQIYPGAVALLHDTYNSTVDATAELLPWLTSQGYHMVTVTKLIGNRAPGSTYGSRAYDGPPLTDTRPE